MEEATSREFDAAIRSPRRKQGSRVALPLLALRAPEQGVNRRTNGSFDDQHYAVLIDDFRLEFQIERRESAT